MLVCQSIYINQIGFKADSVLIVLSPLVTIANLLYFVLLSLPEKEPDYKRQVWVDCSDKGMKLTRDLCKKDRCSTDNRITFGKYTLLNFLPKNLFEQ